MHRGAVSNVRQMCQACNDLRAACGHCVGAMACVRAVAVEVGQPPARIVRLWALRYRDEVARDARAR